MPEVTAQAAKAVPFIGNVLAGYFQWAAYQKISVDLAGSMKDERLENQARLGAGVLAIGATVADTIARSAGLLAETTLMAGRAVRLKVAEGILSSTSKALGILAAGINSIWDIKNAIDSLGQNNVGVGFAFATSSISGFFAAIFIFYEYTVPAIVAALIFIGSGIVSASIQDNKINKWLKHCYWGVLDAGDWYKNSEAELSELRLATGA